MSNKSDKYIGFLKVMEITTGSYIGAILVTNLASVPVEFRVTLPVKPTAIQKSLYGEAMIPYIGTELCGRQLLQNITHQLDLIFVSPDYLVNIRPNSDAPVLHIRKQGDVIGIEASQNAGDGKLDKMQRDITPVSFQPVTLTTSPVFTDDFEVVQALVEEISNRFDLLEPFERIDRAIDVLSEQDKRFAGN